MSNPAIFDPPLPDGIEPPSRLSLGRAATPLTFAILGGLVVTSLFGLWGGGAPTLQVHDLGPARLSVLSPETLRNGEIFEMTIRVDADAALTDTVLAIDAGLWRNITINSQIPAASDEGFEQGRYRLHYGPLQAGQHLDVKIDGQINPSLFGGTAGQLALLDGDREVGTIPLRLRVLP